MNNHQLLRYSRHILLDEIGIEGLEKILAARVLVVGCGGLGAVSGEPLAKPTFKILSILSLHFFVIRRK